MDRTETRQRRAFYAGLAALVVLLYALATWLLPRGPALAILGNNVQNLLLVLALAAMVRNVQRSQDPVRIFWVLYALGTAIWLAAQLSWTLYEFLLRRPPPTPFYGDALFLLHVVPYICALSLRPDVPQYQREIRIRYYDLALLSLWSLFLYCFTALPWQLVDRNIPHFSFNFFLMQDIAGFALVGALAALWLRSRGDWRTLYASLLLCFSLHVLGADLTGSAIDREVYYSGSWYDLPFVASLACLVWSALCFATPAVSGEPEEDWSEQHAVWPENIAMLALVSIPLMTWFSRAMGFGNPRVQRFRLLVSLIAMPVLTIVVLLRHQRLNRELGRSLRQSQEAYEDLTHLQQQLLRTEKLAALGQLVSGAAHEINNPLTAILGYAELLSTTATLDEKQRSFAEKIVQQARRTQRLVSNLLSFSQPASQREGGINVNVLLDNALQSRQQDMSKKSIQLVRNLSPQLPLVWGDPRHLLQVFVNLINNAVDVLEEKGGGTIQVRTAQDQNHVVIEVADSGPGLSEPERVFDPAASVASGASVGLSACYRIVREHDGKISCRNRAEGGACFTILLPAGEATLVAPASPAPARA